MAQVSIQPYVFFDGDCAQALDFYGAALGAATTRMTYAESPMELPPEQAKRIMHATVTVEGATFMAADGMPGAAVETGMRTQVSINTDSPEVGRKYFEALSAGGAITMPYEKQFWGDHFGCLTDRFGVKWMVNSRG